MLASSTLFMLPISILNFVHAGQHNVVHAGQLNLVHAGQHNVVHAGQLNLVHAGQHNIVQACMLTGRKQAVRFYVRRPML